MESISFKATVKKLLKLAWPMASIQFISMFGMFASMMMLSKLGHQVLAASALIFSTQVMLIVVGSSILFSLSVLIGHAFGAKDYLGIGNFVQQGWTLALILSVPLIVCALHVKTILIAMGQKPEIAGLVQTFFNIYVFAIPTNMMTITNQQFCYGIHQQKLVSINNRISTVLLIGSSFLLIFGFLGVPRLGIHGAPLAFVIASWFSFFFMMLNFKFKSEYQIFQLFRYRVHQSAHYFKKMFQIGWPISLQITAELVSFSFLSIMVGWLGSSQLAAYQIVTQYNSLIVVPLFALAQASGIVIGQACGAGEHEQIKDLGKASLLMALGITGLGALIFLTMPKFLSRFYLNVHELHYQETLHLAVLFFSILAFIQIADGVRNTITGALRGLFDTRFPMWTSVFVLWGVSLPMSYFFAFICHLRFLGITFGMASGITLGMLIILWRWKKRSAAFVGIS